MAPYVFRKNWENTY